MCAAKYVDKKQISKSKRKKTRRKGQYRVTLKRESLCHLLSDKNSTRVVMERKSTIYLPQRRRWRSYRSLVPMRISRI
jgi:hypothetical protein